MENITTANDLKATILVLEIEQGLLSAELKNHFFLAYDSLKPVNMLKNALHEINTSPFLFDNIVSALTGFASGYISKKLVVGSSHNMFRKLIGLVLQFGVTNLVANNPETLKSIGRTLFQSLFVSKEKT